MKKIFLLLSILFTSLIFSQTRPDMLIVVGSAQKGGFTTGLDFKNVYKNFGLYFNTRGFNKNLEYESGVDYSSISTVVVLSEDTYNLDPYGMTFGLNYTFNKIGLSLKAGLGYAVLQKETETYYKYDFQFIEDEYSTVRTLSSKKNTSSYEVLLDYDFFHKKNYCLGLQAGYNNIHKSIVQFYIGARL